MKKVLFVLALGIFAACGTSTTTDKDSLVTPTIDTNTITVPVVDTNITAPPAPVIKK